jgi:hypothetical protein
MVDKVRRLPEIERDFLSFGDRHRRSVPVFHAVGKQKRSKGGGEGEREAIFSFGCSSGHPASAEVGSGGLSNRYNCPEPETHEVNYVEIVLVCECDGDSRRVHLRKGKRCTPGT